MAISTTGNSKNLLLAVKDAKRQGIHTGGLLGKDGGELAGMVDMALVVKADNTARIQEAHILAGHILCHLVDYILFQRHLSDE